jgi:hypothetical protein
MERRELLKMIAALTGGVMIGGELLLSGCKNESSLGGATFTAEDIAFLDEVADTILPTTPGSPGAKTAKVGQFMTVMVNDCYNESDQKIFHEGIRKLNESSNKKFDKDFMEITPEQKKELLIEIDKAAKDDKKKADDFFKDLTLEQKHEMSLAVNKDNTDPRADKMREFPNYYFTMMKQLTLFGYFTSKEGATKALRYNAVPGKYEGCIDYKKGDKAWAT